MPILPNSFLLSTPNSAFDLLLGQVAGCNRDARKKIIDQYDSERRKIGLHYAWTNLAKAAPHLANRRVLTQAAARLRDDAASKKIAEIIAGGDDEQIERVAGLLSNDRIVEALRGQSMSEESICRIARNSKKPIAARRWLRMQAKQGVAAINLTLGLIGGGAKKHCSDFEKNLRDQQKNRWKKFAEQTVLRRGSSEISMIDIMAGAQKKRASEVYALSKGLEKHAKNEGKTWAFLTLTAPARMHPNPAEGKNTWDGTMPISAHRWLHHAWRRAEGRCRKDGIIISGVRVAEPHADGCPHWHLLVFAAGCEMARIEEILRSQTGAEHWRSEAGLKFVVDDGRGAAAASYLFKYVLKSIGSTEVLTGESGTVDAWKSTWGIRSFQWLGMPPVGLWRALRGLNEVPEPPATGVWTWDERTQIRAARREFIDRRRSHLARIWRAARRGDGAEFIYLAGGLNVKRAARPIAVQISVAAASRTKTTTFIDRSSGEGAVFSAEKWEKYKVPTPRKPAPMLGVAVILNCPRRSKTKTQTITGAAGDSPLAEGRRRPGGRF